MKYMYLRSVGVSLRQYPKRITELANVRKTISCPIILKTY